MTVVGIDSDLRIVSLKQSLSKLQVYDLINEEVLANIVAERGHAFFMSPDAKRVSAFSSFSPLKSVTIWDAKTGDIVGNIKDKLQNSRSIANLKGFSADGKYLLFNVSNYAIDASFR